MFGSQGSVLQELRTINGKVNHVRMELDRISGGKGELKSLAGELEVAVLHISALINIDRKLKEHLERFLAAEKEAIERALKD